MSRPKKEKGITQPQRFVLMIDHQDKRTGQWKESMWTAACRAQGWDKEDRDLRIEKFSLILGRKISSASEIGYLKEFDEIKKRLLDWAQPANLNAQVEMENMARTRLITRILEFRSYEILGLLGSVRFRAIRGCDPDKLPALEDLQGMTEKVLTDLRNTLCARYPESNLRDHGRPKEQSAAMDDSPTNEHPDSEVHDSDPYHVPTANPF